jgi:hypothetical protein
MVSLPDLDCILCVLCCFILLCRGIFSVLLYYVLCYCILSLCYCILQFYCAVHCYLFFCVLFVLYVYLTVYIVL